ncbi:MAG: hypothetical protein IPP15_12030 [Saprospiraceae bacterium]|uniref:Uncharacterized protein n=1 Tax=Candidatus Opimibacter skivensis TaxID=2982028 RepID=A0A9D7SVY1_9BACT|nr:hypothetical protein [Candidatus Opimibacter skivensis]
MLHRRGSSLRSIFVTPYSLFVIVIHYSLLIFPQKQSLSFTFENQASELAISCDLTVDAGPDTNVCFPSGLLGLMGSIEGNAIFFQWTPSTGLNNPLILNPVANITGPITYTLTGYAIDSNNPNLIVNGDFNG